MAVRTDEVAKRIGARIRSLREDRQMRQQDLSNESGVSISTIVRYEAGDTRMGLDNLNSLAMAMNVSLGDLLGGWDSNPQPTGYEPLPLLAPPIDDGLLAGVGA